MTVRFWKKGSRKDVKDRMLCERELNFIPSNGDQVFIDTDNFKGTTLVAHRTFSFREIPFSTSSAAQNHDTVDIYLSLV